MLAKIVNLTILRTYYRSPLMSKEFIFLALELACLLERCELCVTACMYGSVNRCTKKRLAFHRQP